MKLLQSLKEKCGKPSIKRLAAFSSFWVAVLYAFTPILIETFTVHEFVFWGFITFAGSALGFTVWNKKIDKVEQTKTEEHEADE